MGRKLVAGWSLLTLSLFVLGVWGAARHSQSLEPAQPLPDFRMMAATSEAQAVVEKKDLLGHPWIASFIFTRCGGPCPLITHRMAELQKTLPPEVKLVTFSVDPDRDTPDVLRHYARRFDADPRRWFFLTGEKGDLYKLMYEGFRLPMVEDRNAPSGFRVTHSTKLVLVDAEGFLKDYYSSERETSLDKLRKDAIRLVKEGS